MRDPFRDLELDDAFVDRAAIWEPSAAERQAAAGARPPLAPRPPRLRRRPRRGDLGRWAVVAIVAVVIVFAANRDRGAGAPVELGGALRPPAGVGSGPAPLGVPPLIRTGGPHEFVHRQDDGDPVAFDPCRSIAIVVNDRTAFTGADDLLARAVGDVSTATGLRFELEGGTDERPGGDRASYQEARYGQRWAPVLVAWSDPEESPDLAGNVAGYAGSTAVADPDSGDLVYVTGTVVIDGPQVLMQRNEHVLAVLRHELGHLVGLDHVDDPAQLMHATAMAQNDYAAGDRAGLAALGGGPCRPGV